MASLCASRPQQRIADRDFSEAANRLAADMLETREIDSVVVVGKTEPQRIFELLGRKGEVTSEQLALRHTYVEALEAYRRKDWEKALAGFEDCLAIVPCDAPSKLFLERIAQFRVTAPCAEWNGVWSLVESRHCGPPTDPSPQRELVSRMIAH